MIKHIILVFIFSILFIDITFWNTGTTLSGTTIINNIIVENNWFDKSIFDIEIVRQFFEFQFAITIIFMVFVFIVKLLHFPKSVFWFSTSGIRKIFVWWKK